MTNQDDAHRSVTSLIGMDWARLHLENFATPSLGLFAPFPSPSLETPLPALRGGNGL